MKKIIFLAALTLLASIVVFAQEFEPPMEAEPPIQPPAAQAPAQAADAEGTNFEFHMSFTSMGFGIFTSPFAFEGFIELLRFGGEWKSTGLGISFCPFNLYGIIYTQPSGNTSNNDPQYDLTGEPREDKPSFAEGGISIINLTVYWNLVDFISTSETFYMAPFVGINWLHMEQVTNFEKFIIKAGIEGGFRGGGSKVKYNAFSVETGIRADVTQGKTLFFANIKFDLFMNGLAKRGVL